MVRQFENTEQLSQAAADLFVKVAQEAVEQRGRFTVALTGGSSPAQLYALLAEVPHTEQVPWAQTYIFWGDERWVPLTDERSNARMAQETLLNKVPLPAEHIFPMWAEGASPEDFATHYEQLLHQHFGEESPRFDLILLGMGDDGHTASLFPGTEVLHERARWVRAYYLEPQAMYRITLTGPKGLFSNLWRQKAHALSEVLEGVPHPEEYPAQLIEPETGEVFWYVDQDAAALLKER